MSFSLGFSVDETLRALDFYVVPGGQEIPEGLKEIPSINTERGPAWVALKKMNGAECVFLKDSLCMIHRIRPSVCVSFPFVFKDGDGELERVSVPRRRSARVLEPVQKSSQPS